MGAHETTGNTGNINLRPTAHAPETGAIYRLRFFLTPVSGSPVDHANRGFVWYQIPALIRILQVTFILARGR